MAAAKRIAVLDRLQYLGVRAAAMMLTSWPVNSILNLCKALGDFMFAVDRKHRERAMGNIRRSFPDMPEAQCKELARRSMQHLFMLFVEMLFTTRLIRIDTWRRYVEIDNFQQTISLLLAKNQGLIMLTGHYGNWEILGYTLATLGFETTSVARPLDNPYLSDFVYGVRERKGQRIIDKKGATTEVSPVLEKGGVVCFVADQNAGTKGIFVDFFGRKASTYKSIGLLAMAHEVPVVIGYARRLNDQFHFRVAAQDVIYPADWKDQADPLRYITQRYTKAIESMVQADPGQYLWVHRRWKTRPKGEAPEKFD